MQVNFIHPIQQGFNTGVDLSRFINTFALIDHNRMADAPTPTHTDVLLGRGVATNRHPGNENFRAIVSQHVDTYMISTKKQKMLISRSIVNKVRTSLVPPGRFLEKDADTGMWRQVEDKRALEKTAQALRDGAAPLRKKLTEEMSDPAFMDSLFDEKVKAVGLEASNKSIGKKHRRTKTYAGVTDFLSSSSSSSAAANVDSPMTGWPALKKQRSDPDMVASSTTSAVEMDRLFMAGLRRPQSCSSSSQQQQQTQQQILAQHLSQSVPQHHQLSSMNSMPEVTASNPFAAAMMPQRQQQHHQRRVSNEGPNPSAAVAAMVSRHQHQRRVSTEEQNGLNFMSMSGSSQLGSSYAASQPMTNAVTTSINGSAMNTSSMEPLSYAVPPPPQVVQGQHHQVNRPSANLGDSFTSSRGMSSISASPMPATTTNGSGAVNNNAPMMEQEDEFVREMGLDEHFFGLCNSDPIGDADFE